MYITQLPKAVQLLLPGILCSMRNKPDTLYLTFDDGPSADITPWILHQLERYNAKATFFCSGKQVETYPEQYEAICRAGHQVGHHTYHHADGWRLSFRDYLDDVERGYGVISSSLFRPPYGRLTPSQYLKLASLYRIVLWDILTGDFDPSITGDHVLENAYSASGGSILVFHDSKKARQHLTYVLPKTLAHFSERGFTFDALRH